MSGHPIVDDYVSAVGSGDVDAIVGLFADDARLANPFGTFVGADEITGFYRDIVVAGGTVPVAGDVLAGERADGAHVVMAELTATSRDAPEAGAVRAVDVFRLDTTGRITSLEIYYL